MQSPNLKGRFRLTSQDKTQESQIDNQKLTSLEVKPLDDPDLPPQITLGVVDIEMQLNKDFNEFNVIKNDNQQINIKGRSKSFDDTHGILSFISKKIKQADNNKRDRLMSLLIQTKFKDKDN